MAVDTNWDDAERATKFAAAYEAFLTKRGVANVKVTRNDTKVTASYTAK